MRILLDECLPKDLAKLFGHEVQTVPQAGWAGISNAKLLQLIASSRRSDLFVTTDKNVPPQNQIRDLPFAIVILRARSNRLEHIFPFVPEILRRFADFQPGHAYTLMPPA